MPVPARPGRRVPAAALALAVLALLLPGSAAAGATDCDDGAVVRRVEVRAVLAGDGEVTGVERERTVETADGDACQEVDDETAEDLPVAVGVLHRGDAEGALEPGEPGDADGRVLTRVAVRDRTAAPRSFQVDIPEGTEEVTRDVAVPHLVRVEVTYPAGWSAITPEGSGNRTDLVDGQIRVGRTALLFPPVTGDELVVAVGAVPGGGVPEVVVAVTPVSDGEVARLADDELDRDATAVVAALTELGADGAEQLADGTRELAGGLDGLVEGAEQLAGGLGEAATGSAELAAGADGLAAGTGELAVGTSQLAAGLQPLAEGSRQVADGNRQLADQLGGAAVGATQVADGTEGAAGGAGELAGGTQELAAGAGALAGGVGATAEGLAQVAGASGQLAEGADEAATGAGELADGADELPQALREATDTADRAGGRQAEDRAVIAEGRRRAEEVVAAAAGDAPTGVLSTRLVAAGSQPLPWLPLGLAAAVVIAAAVGGRWWWTRRAGGAA